MYKATGTSSPSRFQRVDFVVVTTEIEIEPYRHRVKKPACNFNKNFIVKIIKLRGP